MTAPRLKAPPGSKLLALESLVNLVSWNANSELSSVSLVSANDCQNGVAPDAAILWKARPINPESGVVRSCDVVWLTSP